MDPLVYLDYAATSAVRPPEVAEAVVRYLRDVGATPGRSGHRRATEAGRVVLRCRRALAALFNAPGDPGRVTLHLNATHALNAALAGLLRPGDRVVRTAYDHNAVRRPVAALRARGVEETVLPGRADGTLDLDRGGARRCAARASWPSPTPPTCWARRSPSPRSPSARTRRAPSCWWTPRRAPGTCPSTWRRWGSTCSPSPATRGCWGRRAPAGSGCARGWRSPPPSSAAPAAIPTRPTCPPSSPTGWRRDR
jgi:hypothetical protein